MMKRIISLVLCLGMLAGALLMAGCNEAVTPTSDEALPMTLNFVGITEDTTTPEAIEATEEALNRIFKTEFKTRIELTLVTADEYIALVESRVAEAEQAKVRLNAINKYNSMAQSVANKLARAQADENEGGLFSKWTQSAKEVEASTLPTGTVYTAEQTTVHEDGKIETVYPNATSPIDILMIDGKEMYDYLDSKGYLLSISNKLTTEFTKFRQYIYPTYLEQLEEITGDIKAIPNNNLLAEYTYLVVDKALADKYDLDVDAIDSYDDLDAEGFLAEVKANENVTVLATEPDALGIYTYFDGDVAVGTYYNPIYGYNVAEGTDFTIRNLFDIPEYTNHLLLMDTYRANGYFAEKSEAFAVDVVKGDASLPSVYGDDYYVKVLQNPFAEVDSIFDGMLAVSNYTSNETRALQIIQAINTDPEVKNILQYGIAYDGDNDDVANYEINEVELGQGKVAYTIKRLNDSYMMDNSLTGNVYMGYPEEGQLFDIADYYKKTNLDSGLSPFLLYYVSDEDLDGMLNDIIRRACLTEAFTPIGIDYDEYERTGGTTQGNTMRRDFKLAYVEYFIECLRAEGSVATTPLNLVTKGEGSALDRDFIEFVLSKEGQAILSSIGYTAVDKNADPYVKKDSMSGKIGIMPITGTSLISYVEPMMKQLTEAYKAMYPDVKFTILDRDQNNGYKGDLLRVDGVNYTIGLANRDLTEAEAKNALNLTVTNVAKSYLEVFNNDSHDTYRVSWYEHKMIEKITAEKYSDITSGTALKNLAMNKLAQLCGIDLTKYAVANRPASESVVLASARSSAANYYTNLEYLRVMADELLFTDEESAARVNLKGSDYETSVFEYVRANYETQHNLTEEDYVKLVQDFMVSVLEYTSAEDKTTKYTVSWDEFQETKANAQIYLEAATKIKDAYYSKLTGKVSAGLLKLYSLTDIIDLVYDVMYDEYLAENGFDKTEFENSIKDIYFGEVGSSAEEFASYAKTSDEYKNVCNNLRKEYKKLLIEIFGKTAYDKGDYGISNNDLLTALFDHFLEEEIQVNDKMCALADIDYKDFVEAKTHMDNYDMYLSTMKTMFVYTLRTKYTSAQIDKWTYEEAETNLFNILYETGFYTNELAQYIGLSLSDYMLAKSNATTYQTYLNTLVNALATELKAAGYNPTELVKETGSVIEAVCLEVILDAFYGDKIGIAEVVEAASAGYVKGIATATNLEAYLASAKEATDGDYFYMAVIDTLQSNWVEAKGDS